jgi:hypothetical protein
LPVGGSDTNAIVPGRLELHLGAFMLDATTVHVEDCPDLGPQCASTPPPTPYVHHVELFVEETDLDATYGLAQWLAIEARFPMRLIHETPTYFELDGTPKDVPNDIHHRNETLFGPGDPWLVLRAGAQSGRLVTAARIGVTAPLGSTVPDPYVLGRQGLPHEHIQLGTGTFVPMVGGAVAYVAPSFEATLTALVFFSLYENDKGYRAPSRGFATLRATLPLMDGAVRPYLATDFVREGREVWHGVIGSESYGRTDLLAGGGVAWRFAPPWTADVGVRLPVVHDTQGARYDYAGVLQLGVGTSFDLAPRP